MITNFPNTDILLEEYNKLVVEVASDSFGSNRSTIVRNSDKICNPYVVITKSDGTSILKQYNKVPQGNHGNDSKLNVLHKAHAEFPDALTIGYVGNSMAELPEQYRLPDLGKEVPISVNPKAFPRLTTLEQL